MKPTETEEAASLAQELTDKTFDISRQIQKLQAEMESTIQQVKRLQELHAWLNGMRYKATSIAERLANPMQTFEEPTSPPKRKAIWHNPDNLKSAGEGYRFLIQGVETAEIDATHFYSKHLIKWMTAYQTTGVIDPSFTYRTNKPLPEGWEA